MTNFYRMVKGNIEEKQIEIYDQMNTEEINEIVYKSKSIKIEKIPKLFYKPSDGVKTDLVRGAVSFPVISEKLKNILVKSGDQNLEFHKIQMTGMGKDEIELLENYYFLNILNTVDCFDLEKSEYTPMEGFPKIALDIKKIVLDNAKIGERKIFRIIQVPSIIFISENIKKLIETENLLGIEITSNYLLS